MCILINYQLVLISDILHQGHHHRTFNQNDEFVNDRGVSLNIHSYIYHLSTAVHKHEKHFKSDQNILIKHPTACA